MRNDDQRDPMETLAFIIVFVMFTGWVLYILLTTIGL